MSLSEPFYKLIAKTLKNKENPTEKEKAIKDYIKLITIMARKYVRSGVGEEDLVMEGLKGLMEAVEKFDAGRSTAKRNKSAKFKIYAITRIRGRMYEYFLKQRSIVHIPTHISKTVTYIEQMFNILEKEPTVFNRDICIQDIILNKEHPIEQEFDADIQKKIKGLKQRITKLADNSLTTYERLVRKSTLACNCTDSETFDNDDENEVVVFLPNTEDYVLAQEEKELLRQHIGDRKYFTIMMKLYGYRYQDIRKALYENEMTDKLISRQAVKGSIETALNILRTKGFIKEE